QITRAGSPEFDMLSDPNQHLMPALLERCGIAKIVFHLTGNRRPLETIRFIFSLLHRKAGMNRADHGNLCANDPAHDALCITANAFDARHEVDEVTKLAEKLARAF